MAPTSDPICVKAPHHSSAVLPFSRNMEAMLTFVKVRKSTTRIQADTWRQWTFISTQTQLHLALNTSSWATTTTKTSKKQHISSLPVTYTLHHRSFLHKIYNFLWFLFLFLSVVVQSLEWCLITGRLFKSRFLLIIIEKQKCKTDLQICMQFMWVCMLR